MPTWRAIGNKSGPNSTIAGMPSSTEPSTTNATIDTIMKVAAPPGSPVIAAARSREKPDCVSAHAMAVAAPMMSRIAPHSDAVSISIGISRCIGKPRVRIKQTTIV